MSEAKVSDLFACQEKLQYLMFNKQLPEDSIEDFKYSMLGLIGEIGEVLEADKRWKNIRKSGFNREEKLDELVDCAAFLINAMLYSGYSESDFSNAFINKYNKNVLRYKKEVENDTDS